MAQRELDAALQQLLPPPFPPLSLWEADKSVLTRLGAAPARKPGKVANELYPRPWPLKRLYRRFFIKRDLLQGRVWSKDELDEAYKRSSFPYKPSELFLNIYADILTCLTREPLAGSVSPALIGTSGTIPLSIISTIPDIMRHYYDVIVLAQKEVFLVTNYWQPSDSVNTVAKALRDLDKRIAKRKGEKVIVKIMWDRGAFKQLVRNHARVGPATYTKLGVPKPEEVPNLSIEIINFHRPLLGTFHQKSLVVDRKVALLNSNNIQDRPNLEMMVHLEGPVVDAMYDCLLMSWDEAFKVALPCLQDPPHYRADHSYTFTDENPYLKGIDVTKAAKAARLLLEMQRQEDAAYRSETGAPPVPWWKKLELSDGRPHRQSTKRTEQSDGNQTDGQEKTGGVLANLVWQAIDKMREEKLASTPRKSMSHSIRSRTTTKSAKEEKARESDPEKGKGNGDVPTIAVDGSNTIASSSQETQVGEKRVLADGALDEKAAEKGDHLKPLTDEPEMLGARSRGNSAASISHRLSALATALNAGARNPAEAAITDESLIDDFKPHSLHKAHKPFPIALANRRPHGFPGHQDVRVPQAAAWLAALRYAQKEVFIQTPTLNAKPIVRAIIEACTNGGPDKTGISVALWLDLGFNDQGESVPFQGGTNEEVVVRLYTELRKRKKQHNLQVFWYTGKDQIRPLNAVHKTRNCHIKFMSVDGQVGIMGNGNQDTQSWYHSGEQNVVIDSAQIVGDWMEQLRSNQSTGVYGKVDDDGIYRDPDTREPLQRPPRISCFSAIWSMI